jgi:hypothetical protein
MRRFAKPREGAVEMSRDVASPLAFRSDPTDARAAETRCGSLAGYRAHLLRGSTACDPCQDAAAIDELGRALAKLTWPTERVKLSVLLANRPELATLPLIGSRLAAGVAESA